LGPTITSIFSIVSTVICALAAQRPQNAGDRDVASNLVIKIAEVARAPRKRRAEHAAVADENLARHALQKPLRHGRGRHQRG
jgi:hypothetical protein